MSTRISFTELIKETESSPPQSADRRIVQSFPALLKTCIDDNLTKTQKCYIMLYYKKNMNIVEIAELFHVNKSTVSRTINRGRQRLLKAMNCQLLKKSIRK